MANQNQLKISDIIKNARLKMGITAKEFGDLVGVSTKTVNSWEQGLRNPSKSALILINRLLNKKK